MTDVWLYLDKLLGEKLFVARDVPKQNQAATEAGRCKKLIGALRYLYRNSFFARRARAVVHAERVEADPELFEGEALRDASEHESDECEDEEDINAGDGEDDDDDMGDADDQEKSNQEESEEEQSDKEQSDKEQSDKEAENEEGGDSGDDEGSEANQGASSPFFPDNFSELFGKPELEGANSDVEENPMDTASTLVLGDDVATLDDVAQEPSGSEDETSTEDGSDEEDGHVENDLVTPPKRPAADTEALDRKSAAKSDDFRPDDLDNMDPEAAWKKNKDCSTASATK
ncbi:unnamed protein product [Cladocopium goreaui]|uniref:Uncharacterized protein n=1 Tax=Cladocopium goreaui TaxID=2562237 RepID=A0A9P1GHD5_9DINO|nr:unnamed protein product [Cladocopium goreaui]